MRKVSHLIIAGVTRAGTTSLFNYLFHHEQICGATLKETRFFLDETYPLPRAHSFTEGYEKYGVFFEDCGKGMVWLEATPDYLYSAGTAKRIFAALPEVGLVFILRDPIARLLSWFRFAKQNGYLDKDLSFDEYVLRQRDAKVIDENTPQEMRALDQGCYSKYLKTYYDVYGADRILITTVEALQGDPQGVLYKICDFAGLDADFYEAYLFEVSNQSFAVRSRILQRSYWHVSKRLRVIVHNRPFVRKVFRMMWHAVRPFYMRYNQATDETLEMATEVRDFLNAYYKEEPQKLAELLGLSEWFWNLPEKAVVRK